MASYDQEKPIATGVLVHAPMVPWSTGLCGYFDNGSNCCLTCWCPCITFGQTSEIIDRGFSSCGTNGALYELIGVFTGCFWIYSCMYRTKFRQLYNSEGSSCNDCLTHFCCTPCALCQEYRELKNKGFDVPLGWHGNMERGTGVVATAPPSAYGTMNR
ncbi:hypothetical protein MKW98_027218 [Papaver atlanticum]|uniref:Uncharacterized protein n=1 Tax=Papaver atlanticum TaxID=357466 RepID=A0AAD4RYH9_9MAGN|nr:hypothetical protein MKW98_027218 [Papaver atlanticum]